jgi:hypothetical protein
MPYVIDHKRSHMKRALCLSAALVLLLSCSDADEKAPEQVNTTDSATVAYPPGSMTPTDTADYNKPGPSEITLDSSSGIVPGPDSGSAR